LPETRTESPTATVGAELVKTNRPSLVAGLASGVGSWIQKPLEPLVRTAVTMPGTLVTAWPFTGETQPAPWMSWMRSGPGCGVPPPPPEPPAVGVGSPAVKSAPFWSVSAPEALRATEVVLLAAGASAEPSWTTAVP
jgi:hypothetical protein